MKQSSYPIRDNRPIDQWKVTELKEELKRRRLPLKGLKEDLVRRLDEALRAEREAASARQEEVDNSQLKVQTEAGKTSTANITLSDAGEFVEAAKDREANVGGDVDGKSSGQVDVDNCVNDAARSIGEKVQVDNSQLNVQTEAGKTPTANITLSDVSELEQDVEAAKDRKANVGDVVGKSSGQVDIDNSVNDAAKSIGKSSGHVDVDNSVHDAAKSIGEKVQVDTSQFNVQTEAGKTSAANVTLSDASELEQDVVEGAKDGEANVGGVVDGKSSGQVDIDNSVNDAAKSIGKSSGRVDVDNSVNDAAKSIGEKVQVDNSQLKVHTEAGKTSTANVTLSDASELKQDVVEAAKDRETNVGGNVDGKCFGQFDIDNSVNDAAKSIGEKVQEAACASPLLVIDESVIEKPSTEIINPSENISPVTTVGMQGSESDQTGKINLNSSSQLDSEDINQPNEDAKWQQEDVKHMSDMNSQVSEVSPSFGLPVKNDSISTDSMSINEKMNALKDNIIADDVKLEPDVKPEMVQPSSSHIVSSIGESHPMDVEAPHENKVSVEESDNNVTSADVSKKNYSADLGSPEKLNLDRSSGDDSMEEDTMESKQFDSTYNSDEVGGRSEKNEMPIGKEDNLVDVVDDKFTDKSDNIAETNAAVAASAEKRKLSDQEATVNDEPSKRQHRWIEGAMAAEPQSLTPPMSSTPREAPHAAGFKRSFSRNNSNASDETPKERVVPPATNSPTDSLRIDNFLRPFTLKAVRELLGKTGTVISFWMDHIKTHCYVTYSSVDEAIATRNAVYNLLWPPNGGKLLAAEFVYAQEVKSHLEGPLPTQPPIAPVSIGPPPAQSKPSPRQQLGPRQKHPPPQQPTLPPPPPMPNAPLLERERVHLPPPQQLPEKLGPIVTLDDLFRKTKATPRIYYLPLSEDQVKGKLEASSRNSRQ